jgi:hypothetical protein
MKLGNPTPHEIRIQVDKDIRNIAEQMYRIGAISEIEKKIKELTITDRTIFEWLKKLTKQKELKHKNNRYSLTDKIGQEYEIFEALYGSWMLNELTRTFPLKMKFEDNLEELVKMFGTLVVYTFLRYLEPDQTNNRFSIHLRQGNHQIFPLRRNDKRKYRKQWCNSAIPLSSMLHVFEGLVGLVDFEKRRSSGTIDSESEGYADRELSAVDFARFKNQFIAKYRDTYKIIRKQDDKFINTWLKNSPRT